MVPSLISTSLEIVALVDIIFVHLKEGIIPLTSLTIFTLVLISPIPTIPADESLYKSFRVSKEFITLYEMSSKEILSYVKLFSEINIISL